MIIRNRDYDFKEKVYIMGILNVTPDSFSDGGRYDSTDKALKHAQRLISEGAGIIDVGGESTRPGYAAVDANEEIRRIVPVIKSIRQCSDVLISADTSKACVAKAALEAGADIINDVSGLLGDDNMYEAAAKAGCPVVIMHDGKRFDRIAYESDEEYMELLVKQAADLAKRAEDKGIKHDRIIIDPGIGFGKSDREGLTIIRELGQLSCLGFPVLLGCSKKSLLGNVLGLDVDERLAATIATSVAAVMNGVSILRVHDVKDNLQAVRMTEAIRRGKR